MKWIKKDDFVLVIKGNDKGKVGKVMSRTEDRIMVQGVNMRKKHVKKTQKMQTGRIVEMERSIHISNVALCKENGEKINLRVKDKQKKRELVYEVEGKDVVHRMVRKG